MDNANDDRAVEEQMESMEVSEEHEVVAEELSDDDEVAENPNEGEQEDDSDDDGIFSQTQGPSAIRSFRTRVDENGETIFEFASDEGEEEVEDDMPALDDNDDEPPQPPSVPRLIFPPFPGVPVEDEIPFTPPPPPGFLLSIAMSSDSDSSDEDYTPTRAEINAAEEQELRSARPSNISLTVWPNLSVAQRVAAGRQSASSSELADVSLEEPGPSQGSSSSVPQAMIANGNRRKKKTTTTKRRGRKKKVKAVKKKKPKVKAPPKPPKPQLVVQNLDLPTYLSKPLNRHSETCGSLHCTRLPVDFSKNHEKQNYYKIAEIYLSIEEIEGWRGCNRNELLEMYPDLTEFTIHIHDGASKLLLVTESKLSLEESALRPLPEDYKKMKIAKKRPIIYVLRKHHSFTFSLANLSRELFQYCGNRRLFRLTFTEFNPETKQMRMDFQIAKLAVLDKHDLSSIPYGENKMIVNLLNTIFHVEPPQRPTASDIHKKEDIAWFYGQIKKYHNQEILTDLKISLQPDSIIPVLREYQKKAVHWMLHREGFLQGDDNNISDSSITQLTSNFSTKMYFPVEITEHESPENITKAFYNPYIGYICTSKPPISIPKGGILADEMGLGKTVEIISLILLNPCPPSFYETTKNEDQSNFEIKDVSENEETQEDIMIMEQDSDSDCKLEMKNDSDDSSDETFVLKTQSRSSRKSARRIVSSDNEDDTPTEINLRPQRRTRRKVSPCTFTTENTSTPTKSTMSEENDGDNEIETPKAGTSKQGNRNEEKSSSRGPKRRISSEGNKKKKTKFLTQEVPTSTYAKVKAIYDAELWGYSESTKRDRPRFNGTFFDTNIVKKASFECFCGEHMADNRSYIVTCAGCHSSQHAECVGFDKNLRSIYKAENIPYVCPHCQVLEKPIRAKSTLIVTPSSICHQWIEELQRHVKDTKMQILLYKGVAHHGYLPPRELAQYDLVITTYTVLAQELAYVDLPHMNSADGRQLRNPKRFMTIPSPLPSVFWWRVCLDEAQMVEGINSKMSLMAMRLEGVNRWCITGTPINEGLQDLFGLFAFMGVEPVSHDFWWDKLVKEPFLCKDVSLLYELFGNLIWRTGKRDVLDQLGIPPQSQKTRWLNFSPIERHFYKQQYEICSSKIMEKIRKFVEYWNRTNGEESSSTILQTRLSELDRQTLQSFLQPFLQLRQACCHPQMVKGHSLSLQKGTLTMEELLAQLIKKTSVQCAEDHRLVVSSLNGMAGINMIREQFLDASEKYREILQSAEEHKKYFSTDSLQLLHTMENLADLLDRNHEGIPYTLRDSSLRSDCEGLRKKYLKKYSVAVQQAQKATEPLTAQTESWYKTFQGEKTWWVSVLGTAARIGKVDELVNRIRDDLVDHTNKNKKVVTLANKFTDAFSLEHALVEQLTQMDDLRKTVLEGLETLGKEDASKFLHSAVGCHLRKNSQLYYKDSQETGFRCDLCIHHDKFLRYESILFKEEKKDRIIRTGRKWQQRKLMGPMSSSLTEEQEHIALLKEEEELLESLEEVNTAMIDELRRGTWGDSDTEKSLKILNNFARINGLPENIKTLGSAHIKLIEAMKREFRVLRILWRQIYDQISGIDELSQATTRLCLRQTTPAAGSSSQSGNNEAGSSRRKKKKPKELQYTFAEQDERLQNINILEPHEVEIKMQQMEVELTTAKESLLIHRGQLMYLETLKDKGYGKKGSENSEECPVCHSQLGQEWSVLRCGHSFCSECVKTMCPNHLNSFLCPLCRHQMKHTDVSFVDTRSYDINPEGENATGTVTAPPKEIRGSHSTKVEAIIQLMLELQESHPGEKVLIFSTWSDVLEIIAKGFEQNDIRHCLLNQQGKKFHSNLKFFKDREDIQALLMPLSSGSKGLNIIEATHVVLVEPILNLASEQQAIGRVHRIGQTKPTIVHRFCIKLTIEEQLLEVLKAHDISDDDEGDLTLEELQNLIRDVRLFAGSSVITL